MLTIKSLVIMFLSFLLFSSLSLADTFVVTNLNDPGAGSLRQAMSNSNLNPGPDEIVFEEGLNGTIYLNLGLMFIQDDLTINGPGGGQITIDADGKSDVFAVTDDDDKISRVVNISGISFINGKAFEDGAIVNYEILTVFGCEFKDNSATLGGGAIGNRNILTVNSCLFENNSAPEGGAIINYEEAISLNILNSEFITNQANTGGAIHNNEVIQIIKDSTFTANNAVFEGGAIINDFGTINEISNSTFENNNATGQGGAIDNFDGLIESIINSTLTGNSAISGSAIRNNGIVNISFSTFSKNTLPVSPIPTPTPQPGDVLGVVVTDMVGVTRIRNSILGLNLVDSCGGPVVDFGGNWSSDTSCGFLGDNVFIQLGPLADNGGPTETMALLGGDPINGATINCDALDENGNPTGIPIAIDQRYFPRPFGIRCDSGAVESMPASIVTVTKASQPRGMDGFKFVSNGFSSLVRCGLTGDDGKFALDDGDSLSCVVPVGDYTIKEKVPNGYRLSIICFGENPNLMVDNEMGEIIFSVHEIEPSPDVDCIFTNIKKGSGGGGCSVATTGGNNSIPMYLFIPALILIRRIFKKYRN